MILFSEPWLARDQLLVDADPEMGVVGGWFLHHPAIDGSEMRAGA
jgi:hypothetical protein